jgi:hypothetical protein
MKQVRTQPLFFEELALNFRYSSILESKHHEIETLDIDLLSIHHEASY